MKVISIQVGQPQTYDTPDPTGELRDRSWVSGIFKRAVEGPRFLGKSNLEGDAQADLKNHGGADKAICVYAYEHYAHWQTQFALPELPFGAFGENFTTLGLDETEISIGDTFTVGEAGEVIVQLSQPRQPCWKLARRWQLKELALQVQETGYTGWYFRVLQEGMVQAGDSLHREEHPYPHLTLAEANRVMHHDKDDWEAIAELYSCPLLSASWRNSLRRRLNLYAPKAIADLVYGRT